MGLLNFFHNFEPNPVLVFVGSWPIYWYGLCMVLGMAAALLVTIKLTELYKLSPDLVFDLAFWLIIGGLIGARVYEIFLLLPFYLDNPWQMIRIWEGGLAIHGGIIAGALITFYYARRQKISFWKLGSIMVPGLALGQAIGRWGNYFNQELYGLPTGLPWGIFISPANRPEIYLSHTHFHPTFLYESLGLILIFAILFYSALLKPLGSRFFLWSVCFYVLSYSLLRFGLEFIKLDETPIILGWRWPQLISLLLIVGSLLLYFYKSHDIQHQNTK